MIFEDAKNIIYQNLDNDLKDLKNVVDIFGNGTHFDSITALLQVQATRDQTKVLNKILDVLRCIKAQ